jgi:phenylalanyl-tRNA synthetase beta chain
VSNRRHEAGSIRIFELGKVYLPRAHDLPEEPEILCGIFSGARTEESWSGSDGQSDFYDAKGVLEGMFGQLGISATFETSQDLSLHPQKQTKIVINGQQVGVVGELHPRVLAAFEIENTFLFEVNLSQLLPATLDHRMFQSIARFPVVERDIALIVDTSLASQRVRDIIQGFPLIAKVTIFDVYSGKQVPPGKKSLAYRITFQSPDHTLTDDEVDRVQKKILDKLVKELGATLRSQ